MSDREDNYVQSGEVTEGEARVCVAIIADCQPEEVVAYVIVAHIHKPGDKAESRVVGNLPTRGQTIRLMSEGVNTLYG